MDDKLLDRIFTEIDNNTKRSESLSKRLEEISKIVYSHATSLGLVTKLVIVIITFLTITGLGMIVKDYEITDSTKIETTYKGIK